MGKQLTGYGGGGGRGRGTKREKGRGLKFFPIKKKRGGGGETVLATPKGYL